MSQWLKWRLMALLCAVLLCGGAGYLHAQNGYPPPATTPEAAAQQFFAFLSAGETPASQRGQARDFGIQAAAPYLGSVSLAPFKVGYGFGGSNRLMQLFAVMAQQVHAPHFAARVKGQEGDKIVVEVTPDAAPQAREVVVIAEEGGYRVDVLATYGKWNHLSGAALDSAIYQLTGLASDAMKHDDRFLRSRCQSNLKQIALGIAQYVQDYDEVMPRARRWTDILQPYLKSRQIFTCPALPSGKSNGYAFNSLLSQVSINRMNSMSGTVSVYETSNLSENVFAPGTGRAYRHAGGANFAFADGHVKWFQRGIDAALNFQPEPRSRR